MHHFVNRSDWSSQALMTQLQRPSQRPQGVAALVLGEFRVTKSGRMSAGAGRHLQNWTRTVARGRRGARPPYPKSYRGQLGVTWTWADEVERMPLGVRLHPADDLDDPGGQRWSTALALLHDLRDRVPDFRALTFDFEYTASIPFLVELERRDIDYVGQMHGGCWAHQIIPAFPSTRYLRFLRRMALRKEPGRWLPLDRLGTDKRLAYLAAERIETIPRRADFPQGRRERWMIYVRRDDSDHDFEWEFYVSNLPSTTRPSVFAEIIDRLHVTKFEQQLLHRKLAADHFEGRSELGFYHHVTLCQMAGEFLKRHSPSRTAV